MYCQSYNEILLLDHITYKETLKVVLELKVFENKDEYLAVVIGNNEHGHLIAALFKILLYPFKIGKHNILMHLTEIIEYYVSK